MKLEELKKIAEARTKGEWGCDWCQDRYKDPSYWRAEGPLVTSKEQAIVDSEFISISSNHFDAFLKLLEAAIYVDHDKRCVCGACCICDLQDAIKELEAIE